MFSDRTTRSFKFLDRDVQQHLSPNFIFYSSITAGEYDGILQTLRIISLLDSNILLYVKQLLLHDRYWNLVWQIMLSMLGTGFYFNPLLETFGRLISLMYLQASKLRNNEEEKRKNEAQAYFEKVTPAL